MKRLGVRRKNGGREWQTVGKKSGGHGPVTHRKFALTEMTTRQTFVIEATESIDYLGWLQRVVGWDAILPFVVSIGSIAIASAFQHQPPADILALAGLPVAGALVRWSFGYRHIKGNACGKTFRTFQLVALSIGLIPLIAVDFLTALSAFMVNGNQRPEGVTTFCIMAYLAYLMFAIFAMYPGRVKLEGVEIQSRSAD